MDLSSKIMIGYCIMAVGGLFFIITLLSIIILSNEPELKNLINGVIFSYNIYICNNVWIFL